tara:strand:- start:149 stop:724 length:576 start_codon:yes stop_codon:yes gene_type:complete
LLNTLENVKIRNIYVNIEMPSYFNLVLYIAAGSALGCLMLLTGIPAAPLLGAIVGAGLLSISGIIDIANWPLGTKTLLGIGIGTVIGTGINKETLGELQILWKPALLITISLLLTGLLVAFAISKILGIDPIVAILGSAPGGTIGMSLIGAEYGVGAAVAALHAVRLITVLLLIPALLNLFSSLNNIDLPK